MFSHLSIVRFWLQAITSMRTRGRCAHLRAPVAEPRNAERLPVETVAYRELPAAGAHMGVSNAT